MRESPRASAAVIAALILTLGGSVCARTEAGRQAWAAGDWDAAQGAFSARLDVQGADPDPALLIASADAASRAGRHAAALAAARRAVEALHATRSRLLEDAAARELPALAHHALGAASLRAALSAEQRARQPEADPAAWDEAWTLVRGAREALAQTCVLAEGGMPSAARDLERALRVEQRIEAAREAARAARREREEQSEPGAEENAAPPELSPEELARLMEQLENERARPRPVPIAGAGGAVQDW